MANQATTTTTDEAAVAAVEEHASEVVATAAAFHAIEDHATYNQAAAFLTDTLKPALDELEATFGPIVKKAHEAHKEAIAQRRRHEQPLLEAQRIVKGAMGAFVTAERARAEAEEAERLRKAREEREAAQLAEAERLEEAGHHEAAKEKIAAPTVPVVTTPAPAPPQAEGVTTRMVTKYRIVDEAAIGRKYLKPDTTKIGQVVRAMGADAVELVGGIEVYEEPVTAVRGR